MSYLFHPVFGSSHCSSYLCCWGLQFHSFWTKYLKTLSLSRPRFGHLQYFVAEQNPFPSIHHRSLPGLAETWAASHQAKSLCLPAEVQYWQRQSSELTGATGRLESCSAKSYLDLWSSSWRKRFRRPRLWERAELLWWRLVRPSRHQSHHYPNFL